MNPLTLSRERHGVLVDCLAQRAQPVAMSGHFTLYGLGSRPEPIISPDEVVVVHDFAPAQIDNNIGYYVANELLPLFKSTESADGADGYGYSEQAIFERYVGEIVRSVDGNERRAWHLFYDNTLAALNRVVDGATIQRRRAPTAMEDGEHDFIDDFGAIYRQALALIAELPGAGVLDVATCFGFLPLLLAARRTVTHDDGGAIVACDLNPALVALAGDYARHRRWNHARFIRADILAADPAREFAELPACFDVVTAIHLLEHLEPDQTETALINLWRLTARRLIIAVPLETEPDARYGHRQVFDRQRLLALGRRREGEAWYFEHRGGWLVIDRVGALTRREIA